MIEDVRALGAGEVVAVVNTHEHFDHTFGNGAFRAAYGAVPVHAHEVAAENTVAAGERIKALSYDEPDEPRRPAPRRGAGDRDRARPTRRSPPRSPSTSATGWSSWSTPAAATPPATWWSACPTPTCCSPATWSRSPRPPGLGDDCYPMEWPLSLDIVLGLLTSLVVVVPGHGAPVDRDFVEDQRNEIGIVAETIRDLATRGVPVDRGAGRRRVALPARTPGRTPYAAATSTSPAARSAFLWSDHPAEPSLLLISNDGSASSFARRAVVTAHQ